MTNKNENFVFCDAEVTKQGKCLHVTYVYWTVHHLGN